jgi:hypothetical protein
VPLKNDDVEQATTARAPFTAPGATTTTPTVITTPIAVEPEPEPPNPLEEFYIDYDFNLDSKDYENKIPIKYGSGSQKLIIYSNRDFLVCQERGRIGGGFPTFTIITSGKLNSRYSDSLERDFVRFDSFYRNELFSLSGTLFPPNYYVEYNVDMPSNDFPLIIEFREHAYALQHNSETNSINLVDANVDKRAIWGEEKVAISPNGKIARITGLGDYSRQVLVKTSSTSEYKQIILPVDFWGLFETRNSEQFDENGDREVTPGDILWLDDDILLISLTQRYKTIGKSAGIYYYNINNGLNGLIIGNSENARNTEAFGLQFEWDKIVFNTRHLLYNTYGWFVTRNEMSKNDIYSIIRTGNSLTFNVVEIERVHENQS